MGWLLRIMGSALNAITRVLQSGREGQGWGSELEEAVLPEERDRDSALLALHTEEVATSQGMPGPAEAGKGKEWICPCGLQEEPAPDPLHLAQ